MGGPGTKTAWFGSFAPTRCCSNDFGRELEPLFVDSEDLPLARHAFQNVFALVLELVARADDEISHGSRDQHLPGLRQGRYSGADVDRDPPDVIATNLDLASMQPDPHIDVERLQGDGQLTPARDAARGAIERGEHTIAGRLDESATKPLDLSAGHHVMLVEKLTPLAIAERGSFLGRPNDV